MSDRIAAMRRVIVIACATLTVPCYAEEARVSTAQPFAKGDILVAATVMDDPDDDHKGTGRILQFDADLQSK